MFRSAYLKQRLIFPFSTLTIIFLTIAYFLDWHSLFVNLATTCLGVVITVWYVDAILKKHEESRWVHIDTKINKRVEPLANHAIMFIRTAFAIDGKIFQFDYDKPISEAKYEVIRVTNEVLLPNVRLGVANLNQERWHSLFRSLSILSRRVDLALSLFSHRLSPQMLSEILDIQENADRIISIYMLAPDVVGVSDDQLSASVIESKHLLNLQATQSIRKLLQSSIQLLEML